MNEELYQMMKRMEEANRKQEEYARKQYRMTVIMASACVGVLILAVLCVIVLLPRVNTIMNDLEVSMTGVKTAAGQLENMDLEKLFADLDSLVSSSEESMSQAMEKLDAIDMDTLNEAIQDLANIVRPLSRLFGNGS
ncbi:hypothetical protein [Lachnotalea sp. AF33-28]|uniref:hypothetical protein n=1 Tax=Lachnotalea sp. AF33-28 TaxID=2292046 RepID=UPI000E4B96CC|nr:hypothetical protein [Lachnotalea sp. AF33-28]RHP31226.1 hypothetical protein DWZ56_16780 [Lachnotalea sp. AF33-28]